jgi:hypothetical protein
MSNVDLADLHELEQGVVDPHSEWEEESTSRTQVVEDKQLLFTTDPSVVTLGSLLHVLFVFRHLLRVGERDTV